MVIPITSWGERLRNAQQLIGKRYQVPRSVQSNFVCAIQLYTCYLQSTSDQLGLRTGACPTTADAPTTEDAQSYPKCEPDFFCDSESSTAHSAQCLIANLRARRIQQPASAKQIWRCDRIAPAPISPLSPCGFWNIFSLCCGSSYFLN